MIIDKLENAHLYQDLHKGIEKALLYLKNSNFKNLSMGRQDIENESVFAILKTYNSVIIEDQLLESHLKYIDVQYMIEGVEQIGVLTRSNQEPKVEYDAENDYMLFDAVYDTITLKEGMFAIFFPDDLHLPEVTTGKPSKVKKVVVKVKIQYS